MQQKYLFLVVIVPICDKELIFIFNMFLLFVNLIADRYKYYKINIRHAYFFLFCSNVIYLQCFLFFGSGRNFFYFVGIGLILSIKSRSDG